MFLRVAPFARAAGLGRDALLDAVGERLGRFFGKRGASVVDANLALIAEAYDGLIDVTRRARRRPGSDAAAGREPLPMTSTASPRLDRRRSS